MGIYQGLRGYTDQRMAMGVEIRDGDGYRSKDIGKCEYRSRISWVQIEKWDWVQIRDPKYILEFSCRNSANDSMNQS